MLRRNKTAIFFTFIVSFYLTIDIAQSEEKWYKPNSYQIGIVSPRIEYNLRDITGEGEEFNEELNYLSNNRSYYNLGLSFDALTISLSAKTSANESEDNSLNETSGLDLQLFGLHKKMLWQVFYQNYFGLFISPSDTIDERASNDFTANTYTYGGSITLFNRDNFDPRDSFGFFELRKKTSWSLYQKIKIVRQRLWSNNGLVPEEQSSSNFDQVRDLRAIETDGLGYEFGAIGTWSPNFFYITFQFGIGPMLYRQEVEGIEQEERYLSDTNSSVILDFGFTDQENKVLFIHTRIEGSNVPVKNVSYYRSRTESSLMFKYYF